MPKIFLSYRRDDSIVFAGRICDRLVAHFGRESVFMDVDSIPFGVDFREHLTAAVSACDIFLALIGEKWLIAGHDGQRRLDDPRDFVRIEVEAALQRGIPVVPLLLGKATMPTEADLPHSLAELTYRNAAQIDAGRDFHSHIDRLIRGLEKLASVPTLDSARKSTPVAELTAIPLVNAIERPAASKLQAKDIASKPARPSVPSNASTVASDDPLVKLMSRLNPTEAALARLYFLEGCSYEDIGEKLKLSSAAVSELLSQIRKKMRPVK